MLNGTICRPLFPLAIPIAWPLNAMLVMLSLISLVICTLAVQSSLSTVVLCSVTVRPPTPGLRDCVLTLLLLMWLTSRRVRALPNIVGSALGTPGARNEVVGPVDVTLRLHVYVKNLCMVMAPCVTSSCVRPPDDPVTYRCKLLTAILPRLM